MAYCKYCGKKLEDGEQCTCEEAVGAAKLRAEAEAKIEEASHGDDNAENTVETGAEAPADAEKGTAAPAEEPPVQVVENPPVPVPVLSDALLKRGLILVCALAMCLVLFIVAAAAITGNGYKRPVRNAVKGINRERAELVINSFYPRGYVEELRDNAEDGDMEWSDITDDMDSLITDVKEVCEDGYFGDDIRVSAKIVKKKKATAKDLRTLKKEFEKYDAVVKKAYRLKVRLIVKGDDEKQQIHFYIYSVKLKGGRWVLYADDKTKGTIADKTEEIYGELQKELSVIFSDYSRSLDAVIPKE